MKNSSSHIIEYVKMDKFDKTLKLLFESTHDKDLRESILKVQEYKTNYLDKEKNKRRP